MIRKTPVSGHLAAVSTPAALSKERAAAAESPPQALLENHLLAALPATDYARLRPHLERVSLPLGEVLYKPGARLRHVYFPVNSIISMLYIMEDGSSAEIALVGNEGILGISLFMGGETTPSHAVVQSAGYGLRLKANLLKEEFARFGPLMHLLLRYTQALITQMAQTAVCNRHHSIDQQLCRWLLLSLDRLQSNELSMTQELIANMLGVRREGVTEAAGKLQAAGLITYRRGRISVLDRPRLEAQSCECYKVVRTEQDRLLPYAIPKRRDPPRQFRAGLR
jgi:CRP-like cAMP-binding protein